MRFELLSLLLGVATSSFIEIDTEPIEQEFEYINNWFEDQVNQVADDWQTLQEDGQNMFERVQIEMMDMVYPLADAFEAMAEAAGGEDCDGEGMYNCLVEDGFNRDPFDTDCAFANGC